MESLKNREWRKFQKRILCPQLCIVTNHTQQLQCVNTSRNSCMYIYIWSLVNTLVFKLQALLFLVLWQNCRGAELRGAELMNNGWSGCIVFCIKYCCSVISCHVSHLSLFIGPFQQLWEYFFFVAITNTWLCLRLKNVHEWKLNFDLFLRGAHSFNPSVTLLTVAQLPVLRVYFPTVHIMTMIAGL